jgi:hypothetical protein
LTESDKEEILNKLIVPVVVVGICVALMIGSITIWCCLRKAKLRKREEL